MTDNPKKPSEKRSEPARLKGSSQEGPTRYFLVTGIVLFVFFGAYILSIGPVIYLAQTYDWNLDAFPTIYAPVKWLHDHTFLEKPLEWYIRLFMKPIFIPIRPTG